MTFVILCTLIARINAILTLNTAQIIRLRHNTPMLETHLSNHDRIQTRI